MRRYKVAGGLLTNHHGLLLVANRRRNGRIDWSTPGGVVDDGETALEALEREITEETGLTVTSWHQLCWTVAVDFVDLAMELYVEVYRAGQFSGDLTVDDPDGIVTAAEFLDHRSARERLDSAPRWVSDPLKEWLDGPWTDKRSFGFSAHGTNPYMLRAERLEQ